MCTTTISILFLTSRQISPCLVADLRNPTSASLPHYALIDSFPTFKSGDVFIVTAPKLQRKQWQLQSDVLARQSPYFAQCCRASSDCGSEETSWFSFVIEHEDGDYWLVHRQAEGDQLAIQLNRSPNIDDAKIKIDNTESTATKKHHQAVINPATATNIYDQILGAFYSIPPSIPTNHIAAAFTHSECLVKYANNLDCLHLLMPHINNTLLQYRQVLFTAIKSDPARWLLLANHLQNGSIYTEAMIHLVGAHPCWP